MFDNFKEITILAICFFVFLFAQNSFAFKIQNKKYLFSDQQYIAEIYILRGAEKKSLTELEKFTTDTLKQIQFKNKKPLGHLPTIKENRFFIGKGEKLQMVIKFIDFPLLAQKNFTQQFCNDIDCDFIYRGEYLTGYQYGQKKHQASKSNLNIFKDGETFFFVNKTPPSLKKEILSKQNGDVVYYGLPGEILFFKKYQKDSQLFKHFVSIHKNKVSLPISTNKFSQLQLNAILKLSSADCISFESRNEFHTCKRSHKEIPDSGVDKIKLTYLTGQALISGEARVKKVFLKDVITQTAPLSTQENDSTLIATRDTIEKKTSVVQNLVNSSVHYFRDKKKILTLKFDHLNETKRSHLHDKIITHYNPDRYEVFTPSVNGDLLLSQHNLSRNEKILKLNKTTLHKKYTDITINFKNNTNEITPSSNIAYLSRSKLPNFAQLSANVESWPFRFPVGFSFDVDYYSITHESVDVSGNVTEYSGTNLDWVAMANMKYLLKTSKTISELQLGFGYEQRSFTVEENGSIGDLTTSEILIKASHLYQKKKYHLHTYLRLGYLLGFEQDFITQTSFGSNSGFSYSIGAKIAKQIEKSIFVHLGFSMGSKSITLDDEDVTISDTAFNLGVTYRWGET